jgi:hypothetical protein
MSKNTECEFRFEKPPVPRKACPIARLRRGEYRGNTSQFVDDLRAVGLYQDET